MDGHTLVLMFLGGFSFGMGTGMLIQEWLLRAERRAIRSVLDKERKA